MVAPAPGLLGAARLAVSDLYYHAIRFVPANLAWGLGFMVVVWIGLSGSPPLAAALAPLLALPLVAIARLAGLVVRGHDVVLADAWTAIAERPLRVLAAGIVIVGASVMLAMNVVLGVAAASAFGLALGVLAAWGLVAIWLVALPFWVLLADPDTPGRTAMESGRLALGLLLVRPFRLLGVAILATVVMVVASLLMAALLTVGVAYAVLLTARVVLPSADALADRTELASTDR